MVPCNHAKRAARGCRRRPRGRRKRRTPRGALSGAPPRRAHPYAYSVTITYRYRREGSRHGRPLCVFRGRAGGDIGCGHARQGDADRRMRAGICACACGARNVACGARNVACGARNFACGARNVACGARNVAHGRLVIHCARGHLVKYCAQAGQARASARRIKFFPKAKNNGIKPLTLGGNRIIIALALTD